MFEKVIRHYLWIGILCLYSLAPQPVQAQGNSYSIRYTLPTPGKVSLAIYGTNGKLVKTLLSSQPRSAGEHTEFWNGLDDRGVAVSSPGTCTWKLLQTQGLQADFIMALGTSLPQGDDWWEVGAGNHIGPRCVATDATGIYVGSGISENVSNALKMSWDGNTRIWSAEQPTAWFGRFSFAVMDGWLYHLQQNAKVGAHPVDKPNVLYQSVGDPARYSTGIGWDALWPSTRRPSAKSWVGPADQSMDMAAYNSGNNPQLVLSYHHRNAVQWRNPRDGQIIKTVAVANPVGVAIDNAGDVLAISENKIVKIDKNKTVTTLISSSDLDTPYRIDVDRSSGDIWVAEQGASQQVKKFSSAGALIRTYGSRGGRQYGLYNPANFKDIVDITADNQGGFLVVENSAPRRVARFDGNGNLVKEWYGGGYWVPSSSPDPDDPTTLWYTINGQEIMRLKLDLAAKTWRIHSIFNYLKAGDGKTITSAFSGGLDIFGGGYFDWHVRKRNGITYLVRRSELQIIRVDETDWTLKPVVVANFSEGQGGAQQAYLWTDANGDGLPQEPEYRRYNWGAWNWHKQSLQAPCGFDYFRYSIVDGKVYEHDVISWNAAGAPVYRDLNAQKVFGEALTGFNSLSYYQNPPGIFARESEQGPLYVMINANSTAWGTASYNKMYKMDQEGIQWQVGEHTDRPAGGNVPQPPPGKIYTFKNNVGIANGVVVAADFVGGWSGRPAAITYAWDADGLFVGGLFENPNLSSAPLWQYTHNSDNGAGSMYTDPRTKDVLYFASGENDIRVYRITGWNNWVRQSGRVGETTTTISVNSYAVNSGGNNAGSFIADNYVSGGLVASTSATVDVIGLTNPAPATVYQTERNGNFTYNFTSLTAGQVYTVRLHLVESQFDQAGQRKFNVDINGARSLTDFDIIATAGAKNKAIIKELIATSTSTGQITVAFTNSTGVAKLNGIEIVLGAPAAPIVSNPTPPTPPAPVPTPAPAPVPTPPGPVTPQPEPPKTDTISNNGNPPPPAVTPILEDKQIVVYPNPTSGEVHVAFELDQPADVTLEIIDTQSKTIKKASKRLGNQDKASFWLNDLPSGLYFIRITKGDMVIIRKIVVIKGK